MLSLALHQILLGVYYYFIIPSSDAFIDILDYRPTAGGLIELQKQNAINLTGLFGLTQYDVYIVIEDLISGSKMLLKPASLQRITLIMYPTEDQIYKLNSQSQ